MKKRILINISLAAALAVIMTGCSNISEKVSGYIENDENIGMHAPAVGSGIPDLSQMEALNEEAAQSEAAKLTDEERAAMAAEAVRNSLLAKAEDILKGMTAEEKVGQLLLVRAPADPAADMQTYHLGGYTFYANDFEKSNPEAFKSLADSIAAESNVAPFMAVDEEGGTVVRVSKYTQFREEPFSSPQLLYQRGGKEMLAMDGEEKAKLLSSIGLNLNLAPVCDISDDTSSYIYPRTIGQNVEGTSEAISVMVQTASENGVASCLKHFPGYGDNTDTHTDIAHDGRELYEFYNRDFAVFEAGINALDNPPMVMVGHTIYDMIDEGVPASLSEKIHDTLRERLDFDGVIITDDMSMDAIGKYSADGSVYVAGVLCGNDMLCVTDCETAYNDILAALENGEITEEEIDEHVRRILIMKIECGIIS